MPRFIACSVCYFLIGMAFLGQACKEGLQPDHCAEPTETRDKGLSSAARAGSSPSTPTGSEPPTIAIANNVELTGPPPVSFNSEAQTGTSKIQTASSYFISPRSRTGTGTKSDPFGLPDLLNTTTSPVTQGRALTILKPGDTLYFLGGNYNISGSTDIKDYNIQLLCPTVSGTSTEPITLSAYPGQTVNIFLNAGIQPVFGTESPVLNYVRFLGFTIERMSTVMSVAINILEVARPFSICGKGNEIGYCEIIGKHERTVDNHDGIRLDPGATNTWIHHNNIHGELGSSFNSAGIKLYASVGAIIEDNFIHDNTVGIYDKDTNAPNLATYRRNWVTNNTTYQFLGNTQGNPATYFIYDNVFDGVGTFNFQSLNTASQVYNNFLRNSRPASGDLYARMITMIYGTGVYQTQLWNNIVLSGNGTPMWGYATYDKHVQGGSKAPIAYMDYNVYDGAPHYRFGDVPDYKLSQFKAHGFEVHSSVVSNDLAIFQDLTSYRLKPRWTTAGRHRDPVGPRFPIAQIMNTSRYGARALPTPR